MNHSKIVDLTSGSIVRTLLSFSWPLILANLLQIVYNMVDMVIIGQYVGSSGLSAVSCGGDITNLTTTLCMGFTSAGQILFSQQVGCGDTRNLSKLVGTICSFFAIIAVCISTVGIAGIDFLLDLLNVPVEAYVQAREYSVCCLAAMIFVFGYNTTSAILRGMGDSVHPLIFIAISAVTNLILDIWLVAKLGMGPKGAALATALGQALSCIISTAYLYRKQADFSLVLDAGVFKPDWDKVKVICRLGIPLALQSIFPSCLFIPLSTPMAWSCPQSAAWAIRYASAPWLSAMRWQQQARQSSDRTLVPEKWIAFEERCMLHYSSVWHTTGCLPPS